jgi:pilus assembly protein CpaB
MRFKTSVTFMVAIVLGAMTAKVGLDMMKKYRTGAVSTRVVVAKKDMEIGQVVTADDLEMRAMPANFVPARAVLDIKQIEGRTLTAPVVKDYPLVDSQLAAAGAGSGLQATVPPGMRLVTVDVSESSGVAGLLTQGCKVDVIATLRNGEQSVARTIVQNVTVQFVQRGRVTSSSGRINANASADTGPVKTVTLIVSPKQAVQIELANSSGKPRLVLRGGNDTTLSETAQVSQNELLGLPDPPPKVEEPPPPVTDAFSDPPPVEVKKGWTVEVIKRGQSSTVTLEDDKNNTSPAEGAAPAAEKVGSTTTATGQQERNLSGAAPAKAPSRKEEGRGTLRKGN